MSLIKPSLFSKINIHNRKSASLLCVGICIVSLAGVGISAPATPQLPSNSVKGASTIVSPTKVQLTIQKIVPSVTIIVATPSLSPTPFPSAVMRQIYVSPSRTYNAIPNTPTPQNDNTTGLSNNNYYTNSDGNQVHSPADSTNGQVPAGATAQCNDGTYSFSQHHSGTCSHHGGVALWL